VSTLYSIRVYTVYTKGYGSLEATFLPHQPTFKRNKRWWMLRL